MKLRATKFVVLALLVIAGAAVHRFVLRGPTKDDRQQILELVASVEQAVEEKKGSQILDHVSRDYHDDAGNDQRQLSRLVIAAFREPAPFDLVVELTDLQISGDQATLRADVEFAVGGPVGAGSSTRLEVTAKLRRELGAWKVIEARGWEGASEQF